MTIRWPDVLPGMSMPGFSLSPTDPSIRTDMEIGQQKVRRRTLYRIDRVATHWKMTDAEFLAFRSWYEGLPVSLIGDSDDFSAWTLVNATRVAAGGGTGPDDLTSCDRMLETVANANHIIRKDLTGASVDDLTVVCQATIRAAGRSKASVRLVDRGGVGRRVTIDLSTGALSDLFNLISATVKDRGNGWWRVTITATTGTGGAAPKMEVITVDGSGAFTFVGDITKGLDVCEMQARIATGYELFVPSDADGNARGCDGGSAWFWIPVGVGGGLTLAEGRFTKMFAAPALPGLNREVTAEIEVRNA